MTTVFICLSIALLLAGIVIAVLPPASKGNHKITISGDASVVTVRSAGSSDLLISFDPAQAGPPPPPMELSTATEDFAEGERTVLDELLDPATPLERKRQIARSLRELDYHVNVKNPSDSSPAEAEESPTWESSDACDESMVHPDMDDDEY